MSKESFMSEMFLQEISRGEGLSLREICKIIPSSRSRKPATLSRILRWILIGCGGPNGKRIRLEALKSPSGWISTPAAVTRFFLKLTPNVEGEDSDGQTTKRSRSDHSSSAAKALEKFGF